MTNRVLVVVGDPGVSPVGGMDTRLVGAALKAAEFVDAYPAIQPAKKFAPYAAMTAFMKSPSPASLEAAQIAILPLFHVVAELEGVVNECGTYDVAIEGVFPPPAPVGTQLEPRGTTPEPDASGKNFKSNLHFPSVKSTQMVWMGLGAAALGAVAGVWFARRKKA